MLNEVLNCDFRRVLREREFDIIVTDPPYNIGMGYENYSDKLPDGDYIKLLSELRGFKAVVIGYPEQTQKFFVPALGPADHCMAWCYNANIPHRFRLINCYGVMPDYSKVKQPYKNPTDKRVKQYIENGSEGTPLYEWFSDIQLVKNVSKEKTIHPCPIPEKLIERILLLLTDEGDTVFDPFAGCMTVPVVCKRLNRNYIACEISQTYVNYGLARLAKEVSL